MTRHSRGIGVGIAVLLAIMLGSLPSASANEYEDGAFATLHASSGATCPREGHVVTLFGKYYSGSPSSSPIEIRVGGRNGRVLARISPRAVLDHVPILLWGLPPGNHTLVAMQTLASGDLVSGLPGRTTVQACDEEETPPPLPLPRLPVTTTMATPCADQGRSDEVLQGLLRLVRPLDRNPRQTVAAFRTCRLSDNMPIYTFGGQPDLNLLQQLEVTALNFAADILGSPAQFRYGLWPDTPNPIGDPWRHHAERTVLREASWNMDGRTSAPFPIQAAVDDGSIQPQEMRATNNVCTLNPDGPAVAEDLTCERWVEDSGGDVDPADRRYASWFLVVWHPGQCYGGCDHP